MRIFSRIFFAAAVLSAALSACTPAPSGYSGFIPATRVTRLMDTGGGLPPKPAPTR
jgi:hypothetical protein